MSHSLLFKQYVRGEEAPYNFETLRSILVRHGAEIGGPHNAGKGIKRYWVTFPAHDDGDDFSGDESGIYVEPAGVVEFAIGRPIYGDRLKQLAFELLRALDICMHPDFGEEIFTVRAKSEDIPEALLEACKKGLTLVEEPASLW